DRQAPGPGVSITVPFSIRAQPTPDGSLAEVNGKQILFKKTLSDQDRVYMGVVGFGSESKDYDIRIESSPAGAGVHIKGDRPLSRVALWSIRAPLSFEPFIEMNVEPGGQFTWRIQYDCYTLPH